MYRNLEKTTVVNTSASLEDMEGYAVDLNGNLSTDNTVGCLGVVYEGRPQDMASVIITEGEYDAVKVDGSSATGNGNISVNDPLAAGGGSANGQMAKATIGSHVIKAYAMESASTADATIKAQLV